MDIMNRTYVVDNFPEYIKLLVDLDTNTKEKQEDVIKPAKSISELERKLAEMHFTEAKHYKRTLIYWVPLFGGGLVGSICTILNDKPAIDVGAAIGITGVGLTGIIGVLHIIKKDNQYGQKLLKSAEEHEKNANNKTEYSLKS